MSKGATVVYDNVKDGSDLQGTLFEGLKFWVALRVPMRQHYLDLITSNGGTTVSLENKADYLIVDHARPMVAEGGISYRFIEQSIENRELASPEDHFCGPPKGSIRDIGSSRPASLRKVPFSAEDDLELYTWVKDAEARGAPIQGNLLYQQLYERNKRHPWQSWRDRYSKYLAHKPPVGYIPSDLSSKRSSSGHKEQKSSKPSAKSRQGEKLSYSHSGSEHEPIDETVSIQEKGRIRRRETGTSPRPSETPHSTSRNYRARTPSSDREASLRSLFGQDEYDHLYGNADDILGVTYEDSIKGWRKWAGSDPEGRSAKNWRNYWETIVYEDWKRDGEDPKKREAKMLRCQKSAGGYDSLESPEIQQEQISQESQPDPDSAISKQPDGHVSQQLPQSQISSPAQSPKRCKISNSLDAEIPETQSQEDEPLHKRIRLNEEAQSQRSDNFVISTHKPNSQPAQSNFIDLSRDLDEDEEMDESYLQQAFPDEAFGLDRTADSQILAKDGSDARIQGTIDSQARSQDIVQMEDSATLLASQLGETIDPSDPRSDANPKGGEKSLLTNGSSIEMGHASVDDDPDEESDSLFVKDTRHNGGPQTELSSDTVDPEVEPPSHGIFSSNPEVLDVTATSKEGRNLDEQSQDNDSDTPTPKRPVYDTQAILRVDTQYPDLALPEPSDISEDEESQYSRDSRESSVDTTISETPLDGRGIRDLYEDLTAQGFSRAKIVEILRCTSNYRRLADIVVQNLETGHGIPDDVPGIWTKDDDEALESGDARDSKRLEDKHGWGRVEERVEFLRHWRS